MRALRKRFASGAAELAVVALLVGFARSIALILEDGQVLHTIVHAASMPLSRLGPGESVMSVGMNVSFLAPAMPGPLYTESRLAAFGRRLVHSEAQLFDDTGKLLAKASSPMMYG